MATTATTLAARFGFRIGDPYVGHSREFNITFDGAIVRGAKWTGQGLERVLYIVFDSGSWPVYDLT